MKYILQLCRKHVAIPSLSRSFGRVAPDYNGARTLYCFHEKSPLLSRQDLQPNYVYHCQYRHESSILYADHYDARMMEVVDLDLDLKTRFQDISTLYKSVKLRKLEHINVYQLASKHKTMRDVGVKKGNLEQERLEIADEMSLLKKEEENEARKHRRNQLIARGRAVRNELKIINKYYYELEQDIMQHGLELPVDLHPGTPEHESRLERRHGTVPEHRDQVLSHIALGKQAGMIHQKEVGPMKYYVSDDLACLEQDLTHVITQKMDCNEYTPLSSPGIVKSLIVEGTGLDINFPDQIFILKDKDIPGAQKDDFTWNITKYLSGVSPLGFASYVCKMNFKENTLPRKYCTAGKNYNPCCNHVDLGLFACPESTVVDLFGLAKDRRQADELFVDFQDIIWDTYKQIGKDLYIRMISVAPPYLALNESSRVDIQVWSPWLKMFFTLGSVAMCSDFLSRRLMAKWSPREDKILPGHHVHTVHSTVMNVTAFVGILMETYQTADGHFVIPRSFWM